MITVSKVTIRHNSDSEEVTATFSWTEPMPGVLVEEDVEGVGETVSEALHDLADQYAQQFEGATEAMIRG